MLEQLVGEVLGRELGVLEEQALCLGIGALGIDVIYEVKDRLHARIWRSDEEAATSGTLDPLLGLDSSLLVGLPNRVVSLGDDRVSPCAQVRGPSRRFVMRTTDAVRLIEADRRVLEHHAVGAGVGRVVASETAAADRQVGHLLDNPDAHRPTIEADVLAPGLRELQDLEVLQTNRGRVIDVVLDVVLVHSWGSVSLHVDVRRRLKGPVGSNLASPIERIGLAPARTTPPVPKNVTSRPMDHAGAVSGNVALSWSRVGSALGS
ncbi:MAG: hypothetical protein M0Z49_03515 [Chloroflexi bacterium]|nr:hypothetical protein [Chloroflexota bacterium]